MDQKTMATLLGTSRRNVTYHLNKKFGSGELSKEENTFNPNDGKNTSIITISPEANTQPILYNFEAILSIAFSVNSKRALQVRRWANKKLLNASVICNIIVWINILASIVLSNIAFVGSTFSMGSIWWRHNWVPPTVSNHIR